MTSKNVMFLIFNIFSSTKSENRRAKVSAVHTGRRGR
jgi:hypothetical protein